MPVEKGKCQHAPEHPKGKKRASKPAWLLLPQSYCIIDERKSNQPLRHVIAQFDVINRRTQLIISGVRQMLYREGHVFVLPYSYDAASRSFVNTVKFRNCVSSDIFQYVVSCAIKQHLEGRDVAANILPELPKRVERALQWYIKQ